MGRSRGDFRMLYVTTIPLRFEVAALSRADRSYAMNCDEYASRTGSWLPSAWRVLTQATRLAEHVCLYTQTCKPIGKLRQKLCLWTDTNVTVFRSDKETVYTAILLNFSNYSDVYIHTTVFFSVGILSGKMFSSEELAFGWIVSDHNVSLYG
jgi:hypothetical protein